MAPVSQAGKQMGEVTRLGKLRELQARSSAACDQRGGPNDGLPP